MKKLFLTTLIFLLMCCFSSCNKKNSLFYRYEYNGYLDTIGYVIVEYDDKDYSKEELKTQLRDLIEQL